MHEHDLAPQQPPRRQRAHVHANTQQACTRARTHAHTRLDHAAQVAQAADGRAVRAREELEEAAALLVVEFVDDLPQPLDGLSPSDCVVRLRTARLLMTRAGAATSARGRTSPLATHATQFTHAHTHTHTRACTHPVRRRVPAVVARVRAQRAKVQHRVPAHESLELRRAEQVQRRAAAQHHEAARKRLKLIVVCVGGVGGGVRVGGAHAGACDMT